MKENINTKENVNINEETIWKIPLIVPIASKYFDKVEKVDNENYYRALDLRLCIEKICNELIYKFISKNDKKGWKDKKLNDKLDICEKYLGNECIEGLKKAKNIGNNGVHKGEEKIYKEENFIKAQKAIFNFSIEVFVFYLKKHGYVDMKNGSWVPYLFSTLPPLYRVKILRKYFEFNQEIIVIEKLAMVYAKAEKREEMLEFLNMCLEKKYLNMAQYIILKDNMLDYSQNCSNSNISKSINEAKKNFEIAWNSIEPRDNLETIPIALLISLVLYGDEKYLI